MVVGKDTLYIYGGMMEIRDQEITLDDLYALNLSKLDEWKCLIPVCYIISKLVKQIIICDLVHKDCGDFTSHLLVIFFSYFVQASEPEWVEASEDDDEEDDDEEEDSEDENEEKDDSDESDDDEDDVEVALYFHVRYFTYGGSLALFSTLTFVKFYKFESVSLPVFYCWILKGISLMCSK